jgi:hypothetical protein
MKKAFLFLLALIGATSGFASNTKAIEDVFNRYWSSYVRKDFVQAAADVLPGDLDATRAAVLPVFLAAQGHKDKQAQEVIAAFFGRIVGKARETMSGPEVFAGLHRVMTTGDASFFEMLKNASTTIVFVRNLDDENAEVHYQIMFRGESDMDVEIFAKRNGRWWVRLADDPHETAEQFKAMFTQGT